MKTNTFQEKLEEIKKQVWDAATLNKYNPLGHRLLDAHFTAITDLVLNDVIGEDSNEGGTDTARADREFFENRFRAEQRAIIKGGNHED